MKVPFVELRRQHQWIEAELSAAIQQVRDNSFYILGAELESFEREFAAYQGVPYCVGVGNGLDALTLALRALDIGPGDEVIAPAHTFVATVLAISAVGATPILVDVEPETLSIDPIEVERALTPRTKAVMPVHLYGLLADMESLLQLCQPRGIALIEDAAQGHGAWRMRNGQPVKAGSWGTIGCFSFYPTKNLGALGDGGALVTHEAEIAHRLQLMRNYGSTRKYIHDVVGGNSRLDELQAALLRPKLRVLDDWNRKRQDAAHYYRQRLKDKVSIPARPRDEAAPHDHVAHIFCVQVSDRDEVQAKLDKAGVLTAIHYPVPVHRQPCYESLRLPEGRYPVAEQAAKQLLSLPIYPGITREEQDYVVEQLLLAIPSEGIAS